MNQMSVGSVSSPEDEDVSSSFTLPGSFPITSPEMSSPQDHSTCPSTLFEDNKCLREVVFTKVQQFLQTVSQQSAKPGVKVDHGMKLFLRYWRDGLIKLFETRGYGSGQHHWNSIRW